MQVVLAAADFELELVYGCKYHVGPEDVDVLLIDVMTFCIDELLGESEVNEPYLVHGVLCLLMVSNENVV